MSAGPVRAPVEVNFRATGVPEVSRGLRLVGNEAAGISPKARQAGNSLNLLANAAATGTGSITGLATAAGNVAQGMAEMSKNARLAASAAGIGVLIASVGVLIALAIDAKKKLQEIPEGVTTGSTQNHLKNLKTQEQVEAYIRLQQTNRDRLQATLKRGDEDGLKKVVEYDANILAARTRQREITLELRDLDKKRADDAKRLAEEAQRVAQAARERRVKIATSAAEADALSGVAATERKRALEAAQGDAVQQSLASMQAVIRQRFEELTVKVKDPIQEFADAMREQLSTVLGAAITAGFDAAFQSGGITDGIAALSAGLLSGLGLFMQQLGEQMVVVGIGLEAFANAVKSLKGTAAIAAGVALIAGGSALRAVAGSIGGRGGSGGGSSGGASYGAGGMGQIIDRGVIGMAPATARTPVQANFTIIGPNDPNAVRGIDEILKRINQRGSLAGAR